MINVNFFAIVDHMIRLIPDDDVASRDSGFLEIHHMEHWTRICSTHWTLENSNVACKQMGFTKGTLSSPSGIYEHTGKLHAVLNNVNCTGSEIRLDACSRGTWSPSSCPSKEFVHLTCTWWLVEPCTSSLLLWHPPVRVVLRMQDALIDVSLQKKIRITRAD